MNNSIPSHELQRLTDISTQRPTPRIAVAGVGGYAGGELARLLLRHPRLVAQTPLFLGRESDDSLHAPLSDLQPALTADESIRVFPFHWDLLEQQAVDLLLLATPHQQSRAWVPKALERGIRVIDLSGAWRLHEARNSSVYDLEDQDPALASALQQEAVYGSPELHKDAIAGARLVANPGCYATSVILALAPLLRAGLVNREHGLICDAKSGVSGAGKTPSPGTHFMHAADNLSAYSVFGHRHIGELLEQLHLAETQIQFTPHLLPIPRGILSTIYLRLDQPSDPETVLSSMREFYRGCPFVRIRRKGALPQIQHVVRTNFCDLGLVVDRDGRRVVLVSCLDNLLKGAAGQAVQNLNLMCSWGEEEGLL